jgi:hypothetical protein
MQQTRPAPQVALVAQASLAVPPGQLPDPQLVDRLGVTQHTSLARMHDDVPHANLSDAPSGAVP